MALRAFNIFKRKPKQQYIRATVILNDGSQFDARLPSNLVVNPKDFTSGVLWNLVSWKKGKSTLLLTGDRIRAIEVFG